MPFHNNVYYPYTADSQGTHSSAGIPSLLNSPLSQHSTNGHPAPAPGMTPSSGASTILPFKFRPRRESVDWRRISALDVDLVVSQLDIEALQDHVGTVTFCTLDGERCQRCQSPVDPALIKLLRLAQLTVEWLLHCQELLTHSLRAAEERLSASGGEREQLLAQQKKQEEKVKELTAELKQRKKVIRTQQSLLAPRLISSHKCTECDKSFLNSAFLQNHMQRRHPDEYENQLRSESEKKSQIESLKLEISGLKEQILQQQQMLQTKAAQEREQQSLQTNLQREMDRFKAEEMARMDRKIEDSRDGMRKEMEFLYSRNIQALNEANQNHTARQEKAASPVHSQPERDVDNYKEMQALAIQKLEHQLKKQDKKWETRLQEIKAEHESEKNQLLNELNRTQSSVSEQQEQTRRLQQEMNRRLQERDQTIRAQREQIRNISSNPPTKVVEVPVLVTAPPPEPKPKRVVLDSSLSERKPAERKPEPVPEKKQRAAAVLKRNASMTKEMRPNMEEAVNRRLEGLGVKPDQSGLKHRELTSLLAKVQSSREEAAKGRPDFWRQREEIVSSVLEKLGGGRRGSDPAPESQTKSRQSVQVVQIRPRSSSLPSRATKVQSGAAVKQPKTPQPAPRTKTAQPQTSTPNTKLAPRSFTKTPPFSSDEESEEEDSDIAEQPQKLPQPRQTNPVQIRSSKPAPARQTVSTFNQQSRGSAVTKTAVTKVESDDEDDDWSDVSELQEINQGPPRGHKDQNGNVERKVFGKENKISSLAKKMEKQFADRGGKKPVGGVSVIPERKDEVQELTYTDLEESSDWVVSSLEDRLEVSKPAQGSGPIRKSLDSSSTSVWGTSTGKAPKSGLTEAGTGSTLKSSLCSLSDISDSEEISNKYSKHYS
ncbi:cilium assembly protein DZIP1 isoform X2 [Halichoeres trimaculatus]|uniref:cilium assembly protein DZIP1 isoform X2 n=1 Tax=Halichoeres trimaculatus TaxID=147232 RepID=UPI003D9EA66B